MSSTNNKQYRVSYALNPKKMRESESRGNCNEWRGGGLADIISSVEGDIIFSPFDFTLNSYDQTITNNDNKIDLIIHKMTEELEQDGSKNEKLLAIEQYLQTHPNTILIDPLDAVKSVTSRQRCCYNLQHIIMNFNILHINYKLTQPKYFIINNISELESNHFLTLMKHESVSFPVICKPVTACGSPDAHSMVVIVRLADLALAKPPCIVQQYHDHDEVLYKVYVLGEDVTVFQRPSLPNLSALSGPAIRSLAFDSRHAYPSLQDFRAEIRAVPAPSLTPPAMDSDDERVASLLQLPRKRNISSSTLGSSALSELSTPSHYPPLTSLPVPIECFKRAAERLRHQFGLTMFGFDVILPTSSSSTTRSSSSPLMQSSYKSLRSNESISVAESATTTHATSSSGSAVCDRGGSGEGEEGDPIELLVVDVNFFPSYKVRVCYNIYV